MGAVEFLMIGLYGIIKFSIIALGFLFTNPVGWIILVIIIILGITSS